MIPSFAVIGLGFGDEGKGATVDALCRKLIEKTGKAPLVVRHNGGGQAGHNVVTDDGKHHTFSQFGAGTLAGCPTYLSRFFVLNPVGRELERNTLGLGLGSRKLDARWRISAEALVTTPYHQAANHLRELVRGKDAHGTCGTGFGETVMDSLEGAAIAFQVKHLLQPDLESRLNNVRRYKLGQLEAKGVIEQAFKLYNDMAERDRRHEHLERALSLLAGLGEPEENKENFEHAAREIANELAFALPPSCVVEDEAAYLRNYDGPIVYEGAQGVLLDEWHGFHPHTTWSTTTAKNAVTLHKEAGRPEPLKVIGVTRTYLTRHGAGPFPTELPRRVAKAMGWDNEPHNTHDGWQGEFAVGWLYEPLMCYAKEVCHLPGHGGVDYLAVTHRDRAGENVMVGQGELWSPPSEDILDDAYLLSRGERGEALSRVQMTWRGIQRNSVPIVGHPKIGYWGPTVETAFDARVVIQGCGPSAKYYTLDDKLFEND